MTRLLLVEDNPCVRLAFSRLLGKVGVEVVACESAEAASEFLDRGDMDVALLDCRLPGRLGTDLAVEISARLPNVHVLLMSAEDGFRTVARDQCPGVEFMRKPIAPEKLISAVITGGIVKRTSRRVD